MCDTPLSRRSWHFSNSYSVTIPTNQLRITKVALRTMNNIDHAAELYKQAQEYLKRGYSVIPIDADKKPRFNWEKYQKQLPTEDELASWFFEYKHLAPEGIAIITGELSGVVVLDVEVDGDITGLDMPTTPTAKTGGGGRHYYFKHPGFPVKTRTRILNRKIDVRGDGGYAIVPPSKSFKGSYEWIVGLDTPLADMPEWMVGKIQGNKPVSPSPAPTSNVWEEIADGVAEGQRHDTAVRFTGKLLAHIPRRDRGIVLPLMRGWNENNIPPLPDEELAKIYEDIRAKQEKGEAVTEPTAM